MSFIVGPLSKLWVFRVELEYNSGYRYPFYATDPNTSEIQGPLYTTIPVEQVEGVSLRWQNIYPSTIDTNLGYYTVDTTTNDAVADLLANSKFSDLTQTEVLDETIFPPPPAF